MNFSTRIQQSLARNPGIESKFINFATISLKKEFPSCRTVVFRDFLGDKIVLYTDFMSRKVKELEGNKNVEICWYFLGTREQYRIRGTCTIITDYDYKRKCWNKMNQSSKELYLLAAHNQESELVVSSESAGAWNEDSEKRAFDRFTILLIEPSEVEYLDLMQKRPVSFSIPL